MIVIPEGFEPLIQIGAACAVAIGFLTALWLAVMIAAPSPSGDAAGELAEIAERPLLQIPRFAPTTVIGFVYVPVWLAIAAVLWQEAPTAGVLAAGFGLLYPPLCITAYWLQFTVVRGLADLWQTDPTAASAAYEVIGFHRRPTSIGSNLAVMGYTMWGLGGLAAGIGLLAIGGGAITTTAILYLVTAAFAVAGAIGHVARNRVLATAVMASGITSLASTIGTAVVLYQAL